MRGLIHLTFFCFALFVFVESRGIGGGGGGGRGGGGGKSNSSGKGNSGKIGRAALLTAGGFGGYGAYHAQESTRYFKREGIGMSAWGLILVILGIIGLVTLMWYCYTIGVPLLKDRRRRRSYSPTRPIIPIDAVDNSSAPTPTL